MQLESEKSVQATESVYEDYYRNGDQQGGIFKTSCGTKMSQGGPAMNLYLWLYS